MSPTLVADPLPIRAEDDGTYHVGQTGISLDTVILCYRLGYSPEQVVESYPSLRLSDVYTFSATISGTVTKSIPTSNGVLRRRNQFARKLKPPECPEMTGRSIASACWNESVCGIRRNDRLSD